MKHQLIIFAIDNRYICFHHDQKHWHLEKIEGEQWVSNTNKSLVNIIDIMKDRLDVDDFSAVEVQLIVDASATNQLSKGIDHLNAIACQSFQLLRWEPIKKRAQALTGNAVEQDTDTLLTLVCPLIEQTFHYQDEALDAERTRALVAHESDIEALRKHTLTLQAEKAQLEKQVSALKRPDIEQVFALMPLFYETFFLHVNPSHLALMAGSLTIPDMHTTFTEPDASTLMALKRKFNHLPEVTQQQLLDFARELKETHNLKVRPNMRALIEGDG